MSRCCMIERIPSEVSPYSLERASQGTAASKTDDKEGVALARWAARNRALGGEQQRLGGRPTAGEGERACGECESRKGGHGWRMERRDEGGCGRDRSTPIRRSTRPG